MFNSVKGLTGAQLLGISAGLMALGTSLTFLTGTSLISGALGVGLILTIKYLMELSKTADPLMKVANSLEKIGDNLYKINAIKDINLSKNLNTLTTLSKQAPNKELEKVTTQQSQQVNIQPADVYLDKYKVGQIIFELSRGRV